MNRSMRSDLRKSVRTVLSSREGGMDEWIPRRVEPDSRESDEQVEAVLLQLRGLLAREGGALTGDVEKSWPPGAGGTASTWSSAGSGRPTARRPASCPGSSTTARSC